MFKFEEPNWVPKTVRLISYQEMSRDKTNVLSKIQRLVCKWFKITPEQRYNYKIQAKLHCEGDAPILLNTIILDKLQHKWVVVSNSTTYRGEGVIDVLLNSVEPIPYNEPTGEVCVINQMYPG